jgi:ligand-binding SRPBCC domain-containing protein
MTTINLITKIDAPKKVIFDLSRDIDVHQNSASTTNEIAIAGVTSGLINLNKTVTWRGKHFGLYLTHKSRITAMAFYEYFVDEMEKGKFKSFKHEHTFVEKEKTTVMIDNLNYETPFGIFGKIFDKIILKKHLTNFIIERNKVLKELAENQH